MSTGSRIDGVSGITMYAGSRIDGVSSINIYTAFLTSRDPELTCIPMIRLIDGGFGNIIYASSLIDRGSEMNMKNYSELVVVPVSTFMPVLQSMLVTRLTCITFLPSVVVPTLTRIPMLFSIVVPIDWHLAWARCP